MRSLAFLLSLVLVFTIPWENAITVGEFGTLSRFIGVLTAMVWLSSALVAGRVRKPDPFHIVLFLFILWNIASLFWSVGGDETVHRIKSYFQLAILAWILWDLYDTPKAVSAALEAYILGAYVTIGSTISNYLSGQLISEYAWGRYAGAGLNPVDQALILALGLPVAWHLASSTGNGIKGHVLRFVNYAYIPASFSAIILTASRAALFDVVPAILYIVGSANRLKPFFRILIFTVLAGALLTMQPFIPQPTLERLATIDDSIAAGDLGGRVRLWRASIAAFSEHPLLGIGSGALSTSRELGTLAHNTFLSVLAELGFVGFVLFVSMLTIVVYRAVAQPKRFSWLWLTVLAIWAIGVFTLSWEFRKPTWLFLSLVVASASLSFEYVEPKQDSQRLSELIQFKLPAK